MLNELSKLSTATALVKAADLNHRMAIQYCEIMACIQSAINSIVIADVRQLVSNGLSCYGKDEVPLSARQDLRQLGQECDRYDRLILQTVTHASDLTPSQNRSTKEYVADTAEMLDDSDDVLTRHINAMDEFLKSKTPLAGPTCPRDPWLIRQLIRCTILHAVSIAAYECAAKNEPYLVRYPQIAYMKLTRIGNLLDNLYRHLTPLNKFGHKMIIDDGWVRQKYGEQWRDIYRQKVVFNAYSILQSPKLTGERKDKVAEGGILCNIRDSLYSTRFVDRLIIKRDGYDPHFRDRSASLFGNLKGDRTIEIPDAPDKEQYLNAHPELAEGTKNE